MGVLREDHRQYNISHVPVWGQIRAALDVHFVGHGDIIMTSMLVIDDDEECSDVYNGVHQSRAVHAVPPRV